MDKGGVGLTGALREDREGRLLFILSIPANLSLAGGRTGYLLMDDVWKLLHHVLEVGLQALMVLELVLFNDSLVDVQSQAAHLHKTPAGVGIRTQTEKVWADPGAHSRSFAECFWETGSPEHILELFGFLVAPRAVFAVIQECSGVCHGACVHLRQKHAWDCYVFFYTVIINTENIRSFISLACLRRRTVTDPGEWRG